MGLYVRSGFKKIRNVNQPTPRELLMQYYTSRNRQPYQSICHKNFIIIKNSPGKGNFYFQYSFHMSINNKSFFLQAFEECLGTVFAEYSQGRCVVQSHYDLYYTLTIDVL